MPLDLQKLLYFAVKSAHKNAAQATKVARLATRFAEKDTGRLKDAAQASAAATDASASLAHLAMTLMVHPVTTMGEDKDAGEPLLEDECPGCPNCMPDKPS